MKSYDRSVLWLNYFDAELKQKEGRRVPLHSCVRSPTIEELTEACLRLKLEPQPQPAHFPRTPRRMTGYVSVKKSPHKQSLLLTVARELSAVRGAKSRKA